MNDLLIQQIAATLLAHRQTLSTAESCTGGLVGATLTDCPGSSAWYHGGIIAYDNALKIKLLGVPATTLETHGAVSPETACAMAEGLRAATHTHYTIAITGIAGPTGGTPEKPIGLVYIAIGTPEKTTIHTHHFADTRTEIRQAAVTAALQHLFESQYPIANTQHPISK